MARFAALIPDGARVLDLACGQGRHARWLADQGYQVLAVDRDVDALDSLRGVAGVETLAADLEAGPWPLQGRKFAAVVVTNYLHRPRMADVLALLPAGGVLIYETFMCSNERLGRPRSADFLLEPNELLDWLAGGWTIVAFEQGEQRQPRPAVIQRVCALRAQADCWLLP